MHEVQAEQYQTHTGILMNQRESPIKLIALFCPPWFESTSRRHGEY